MKTPKEGNDFIAERLAYDIFGNVGNIAPPPKYDQRIPHKYFIEKYAGGPWSN